MMRSSSAHPALLLAALYLFGGAAMQTHAQSWKLELHALSSRTLTDREFLMGAREGASSALTAQLRLPSPAGKTPAVVLLHGSGGASGYVDDWARRLNELGVATLLVDSFTGRGIDTTLADQSQLGRLASIVDAYRAFDFLAQHPRIDAEHIALMGFSRGGQAALYAAVERFQALHGPKRGAYAAYIAFYPACNTRFIDDERVVRRPIHVLHGTQDTLNGYADCREYIERVRAAGGRIELHSYEGAHHVFDWPMLRDPLKLTGVRTNMGVRFVERERGLIVAADTGEPAQQAEPRLRTDPVLAYDERAFMAAQDAVADVIQRVLLGRSAQSTE